MRSGVNRRITGQTQHSLLPQICFESAERHPTCTMAGPEQRRIMASSTAGSLRALDWLTLFMADVKDGVGIYLAVYLLTEHRWNPAEIGLVMSLPWILGIAIQP